MTPVPRKSHALPKLLFILILAGIAVSIIYAALHHSDAWPVPEEAKQLKNPLQPSSVALQSARKIYEEKCANCHGDSGKGDGPDAVKYEPAPADFTDSKRFNNVTDGELFYKISEGRKPMPAFKTKLNQDQRWQLVLLIRSLATTSDHH